MSTACLFNENVPFREEFVMAILQRVYDVRTTLVLLVDVFKPMVFVIIIYDVLELVFSLAEILSGSSNVLINVLYASPSSYRLILLIKSPSYLSLRVSQPACE